MTRRWATGSSAICVTMLLACATVVNAQAPAGSRTLTGFAAMSVGSSLPTEGALTMTDGTPQQWWVGLGSVSHAYQLGPRFLIDVSGGAVVARHFIAAVSYSYFTDSRPAQVAFVLTAPPRTIVSSPDALAPLTRSEGAVHISGGYQGDRGAFEWQAFAGPSRFTLRQQLAITSGYSISDEPDAIYPLRFSEARASWVTATAWGFHVGGELRYFLSPAIGVGVTVRYSRAAATLPYTPLAPSNSLETRVGGVDVFGGLRWRF